VRLFDDDPGVHGRYFDGIDLPVENMHDLIAQPPRNLIVFSRAFGDAICDRVAAATDGRTAITTIGRLAGGGDCGQQSLRHQRIEAEHRPHQ